MLFDTVVTVTLNLDFCFFLQTTVPPHTSKNTVEIQKTLDDLKKDDFKLFQFHLHEYKESKHKPIPRGKLEDKDTMDTAVLLTNHYGNDKALQVTIYVLKEINQRELACQLEKNMDQTWIHPPLTVVPQKHKM
uniref:Pyrin domain-containing protein n=1 Tax=Mastacembelus armatus TaxID=205130 RepID=A0A7N9AUD2_9TELE